MVSFVFATVLGEVLFAQQLLLFFGCELNDIKILLWVMEEFGVWKKILVLVVQLVLTVVVGAVHQHLLVMVQVRFKLPFLVLA